MRIAEILPLYESVPPRRYGGTERVVHCLTENLVHRGHDVVLFASGDSRTSAELFPSVPRALREAGFLGDPVAMHRLQLDHVIEQLHTLHGPLTGRDLAQLQRRGDPVPLVSISEAQRAPFPEGHWLGTIHHGLPVDLFRFEPSPSPSPPPLAFPSRSPPRSILSISPVTAPSSSHCCGRTPWWSSSGTSTLPASRS